MPIEINGFSPRRTQTSSDRRVRSLKGDGGSRTAAGGVTAGDGDQVTLTGTAARLRAIEQQLARVPVVDLERVQSMQDAIKSGEYRVDPQRVADKMIELEAALDGV